MNIDRALVFSALVFSLLAAGVGPGLAQTCTRQDIDVIGGEGAEASCPATPSSGPTAHDLAWRRRIQA
jgi:hypothetical protein